MVRRLSRVFFATLWAGVLFLIATNIQAGWLYVVIAFFFLFLFISVVYPTVMLRGLSVELSLPGYTERNSASNAKLVLKNAARRRKFMVRVEADGDGFVFEPEGALFVSVPAKSEVTAPVFFKCAKRGNRGPGGLVLFCGAPAAIYYARRRVKCDAFTLVYPSLTGEGEEERAREFNMHDPGQARKIFASADPYHYSLREYTPGDSLRSIHWKLTARRGEPIVRVSERKIFGQANIVVDNLAESYPAGGGELFEAALENALCAVRRLLFESGYAVTVAGTAAPAITLESEASWENALHWFAMIELRDGAPEDGEYGRDAPPEADVELFFGSGPAKAEV